MKREEMISMIAEKSAITKKQAAIALNSLLDGISGALEAGEKVTFVGFGTFTISHRKERKGVNPQTRKKIKIPARKVPLFKAGSRLKEAVK